LIKFKAGKLEHKRKEDSDAFIVTPVEKKGEILLQKGDDQLIHFQWRDRESGNVVDVSDLIHPSLITGPWYLGLSRVSRRRQV
jgi:hypothetical protein